MRIIFFCLTLLSIGLNVRAQLKTNLHIVTDARNHLPGFTNFHFSVNGTAYKLKAGHCLELVLQTDSISIDVVDKRWVKKETAGLHIPAAKDVYVWVKLFFAGNFKNPYYGAEVICKTCFDELKNKCKKTITGN